MSDINKWANFLYNEKLDPDNLSPTDTLKIMALAETLASIRGPEISTHVLKLESRKLVVETAMDMLIDLPSMKHARNGRTIMGRGLLDAWNLAYAKKFGSIVGTPGQAAVRHRDIVTKMRSRKE